MNTETNPNTGTANSASCLSQFLICSQREPTRKPGFPHESEAELKICVNATIAKIQRELIEKECDCGNWFWVEKHKRELVWKCPKCRGVGGVRGDITMFSFSSRRCLMRWSNQLLKDLEYCTFATLTYPDEFFPHVKEPGKWKRDIHTFELRFRRAFPEAAYIWRLEMIDRKSGKYPGTYYPHFHLLVLGVPTHKLRPFIIQAWHEIAGMGIEDHLKVLKHEKSITPVVSRKGVMSYAAKAVGAVMSSELAKDLQAAGTHIGRWWGIACRDNFKEKFIEKPEVFPMTDSDAVLFFRYFRRKIGLEGRSPRSLVCFWDGASLKRDILKILSPPRGKSFFDCTNRPYKTPFWRWAYDMGLWIPALERA